MRSLFALVMLAASAICNAAEPSSLKTLEDARAVLNVAMSLIVKDDIDGAFTQIRQHWLLPENEIDAIVLKTIQQRNLVAPRFGKTFDYALVKEEKVGDFLARYTFVERRETHAIRWVFILYRSQEKWSFNSIAWDDNLAGLFPT